MKRFARVSAALGLAMAASLALLAQPAAPGWQSIHAGVEYSHFTREGPLSVHALRVDTTQVRLDVVHALDAAVGLETVSSIAARHGAIAAVNGGYFRTTGTYRGDSIGTLQIDGALLSEPDRGRSAVGLVRDGPKTRLIFGNVTWQATLDVAGQTRTIDGINRPRGDNELIVYAPPFHRTTLTERPGVEAVVIGGRVTAVHADAGSTPIPADGIVISAAGAARDWAARVLTTGARVSVNYALRPVDPFTTNPWLDAEDVLGGGPTIATGGRVNVTAHRESMGKTFATDLHPRTAIAAMRDGRILLMVVDGRQPGLSMGIALEPLARLLIELGAEDAMNLDGGGSSAMVVQGKVVNRPSDASGERPVSDALVVTTMKN